MKPNSASPFERPFTSDMHQEFTALQASLVSMWADIGRSNPGNADQQGANTNVIIPSITLDAEFSSSAIRAYEERLLFLLFLLRQVNLNLIYVTSMPISERVINYYLNLIPGIIPSNARKRLKLMSPEDASSKPLSLKLLERPRLLKQIKALVPDLDAAHMIPYMTTDLEREVALKLGIPMYAVDPQYYAFGTKSGCRRLFSEEGIPHPLGEENLYSIDEVIAAVARMRKAKPSIQSVVLKLNDASSGYGNAMVDLSNIVSPGAVNEALQIRERIATMEFEDKTNSYEIYTTLLERFGSIVEEYIDGDAYHSPSGQCRITPLGEVELLSSHDQMLGGPTGGICTGAIFPAKPEYSQQVMAITQQIGERLAAEGIIGRFAVDFVVVKTPSGEWDIYAIEINLRKGGTTAPFLILQYLTDGQYIVGDGLFRTAQGDPKHYVSSDYVTNDAYRTFTADDLFDIISDNKLHYDHTTQTGVVLHMVSGVGETGMIGVTAIHDSPECARRLYQRFVNVLDQHADSFLQAT